jgi:small subunit ribosomal protein S10
MFCIPPRKKLITLLKSPHVNKKAREQFHFTSYKIVLYIKVPLTTKLLKLLLLNKPKFIKVTVKAIRY